MQIGCGGYANRLWRLCKLVVEAMQIGCGGYENWLWRLCKLFAEAMWSLNATTTKGRVFVVVVGWVDLSVRM